jgi:hypothetical protein
MTAAGEAKAQEQQAWADGVVNQNAAAMSGPVVKMMLHGRCIATDDPRLKEK